MERVCVKVVICLGILGILFGVGGCGVRRDAFEEKKVFVETNVSGETDANEDTNAGENLEPIVEVDAGDLRGSGVLYDRTDEALIVVTAGHVLAQADGADEPVEVVFGDGFSVNVAEFVVSDASETAFISIPIEEIPSENLEKYELAVIDKEKFDALKDGDEMVLKGIQSKVTQAGTAGEKPLDLAQEEFPDLGFVRWCLGELLYPWIYVEDFGQYMMVIKGESLPGMSGGGVFDRDGYLVGILCGMNEAGETAAVPLNVIMAEYMQLSGKW